MLLKQRVKAESSCAKLKYAEKMAKIKKQKALLQKMKNSMLPEQTGKNWTLTQTWIY